MKRLIELVLSIALLLSTIQIETVDPFVTN